MSIKIKLNKNRSSISVFTSIIIILSFFRLPKETNMIQFDGQPTWKKKSGVFDVTMGSYDGAECCEIVGIYLLNKLSTIMRPEEHGLYRDDGLGLISNATGPKQDRLRKDIVRLFKFEGLDVTCETNLTRSDFLDIELHAQTKKYAPYRKPNDSPSYINKGSNHPPLIINQIPEMIQKRLSKLSCNEEAFNKSVPVYQVKMHY